MQVAERMADNLRGSATVLMVGLADQLGVFKHLAGQPPQAPAAVAAAAGLHERWVRELLLQLVRLSHRMNVTHARPSVNNTLTYV